MNNINYMKNLKRKRLIKYMAVAMIVPAILTGCEEIAPQVIYPTDLMPAQSEVVYEQSVLSFNETDIDEMCFGKYFDNYVSFEYDDIIFDGYGVAALVDDEALFSINPPLYGNDESAFLNSTPIDGISSIEITYKSDDDVKIYYGNNRYELEYVSVLPAQTEYGEYTLPLIEDSSFFKISSDEDYIYIYDMNVMCVGGSVDETPYTSARGVRYVPTVDYNPKEGKVLSLPQCTLEEDGNVTLVEWKNYTFHTFEYCYDRIVNHGDSPSDYAYTDPIDVANYFVLYNKIPPNYGYIDSDVSKKEARAGLKDNELIESRNFKIQKNIPCVYDVIDVFGKDLGRVVSQYNRKPSGYLQAVDYRLYKDTDKVLYYEFDIDLKDGIPYEIKSRGTGRVVGFVGGFEVYDDTDNVALLTKDHYHSFEESSNCGFFNERFDSEGYYTGKEYAPSETVELFLGGIAE